MLSENHYWQLALQAESSQSLVDMWYTVGGGAGAGFRRSWMAAASLASRASN